MEHRENIKPTDHASATMIMNAAVREDIRVVGWYHVQHVRDGKVIWEDKFPNLVTNLGRNDILDKYFRSSGFTATPRMGLKGTGTAVAADTQGSHAGWAEVGLANAPAYTGNRPSITFNAASGQQISHAAQSFVFTSAGTVAGCFINMGGLATKDDTTGVLYSAGDFSVSRAVQINDTLNVTYTAGA